MQAERFKMATYHTCQMSRRETYRGVKPKASEKHYIALNVLSCCAFRENTLASDVQCHSH